ncbi:MAG: hypothetical protein CL442_00540 [Acidimicrobiaceae bacterium]|nr:hypothetical protein [Acidimicrobiaceae bacterium]
MRDLCMRSACQGAADVLVVMDVAELTFTLQDLAEVDGPGAVVLCATHVGRLVAPVGWRLVDERGVGELIQLPERPPTLAEATEESPAMRSVEEPEPVPEIRPVAAVHPLEAARLAHEAAQAERAVQNDDAPGPDARATPMLARAFGGVERESVEASVGAASGGDDRDPFAGHAWDQSDVLDEREYTPAGEAPSDDSEFGEQLTFGGDPGA